MSSTHGKKRHYLQWKKGGTSNPQRGAPGVLVTCESGREEKCRWEALQILQHDWDRQQQQQQNRQTSSAVEEKAEKNVGTVGTTSTNTPQDQKKATSPSLRLEEELALLRNSNKNKKAKSTSDGEASPFEPYDTGVRGVVFLLCTGCRFLVPPRTKPASVVVDGDDEAPDTKKAKRGEVPDESGKEDVTNIGVAEVSSAPSANALSEKNHGCYSATKNASLPVWNPLDVVRRVVEDIEKGGGGSFPSSRFIARMIPVQATCFSGVEEIRYAVQSLVNDTLRKYHSDDANQKLTTFAIQTKIRICGHLTRDQIIEAVGKQVVKSAPGWKVNLNEPDYRIMIEVCKSVAGISVIPSKEVLHTSTRKFNLAELRTRVALSKDEDE